MNSHELIKEIFNILYKPNINALEKIQMIKLLYLNFGEEKK